MDKTFWGVVSAAVERSKVNMVAQERMKLGLGADPRIHLNLTISWSNWLDFVEGGKLNCNTL